MDEPTCPYCAENIQPAAMKCPHCHEWLDGRAATQGARQRGCLWTVLIILLLGILSCAGLLWCTPVGEAYLDALRQFGILDRAPIQ